ncbi:type 2 periplasmic-binding domain-containing protein [Polaromonas glacialis]|uniref:hypothetical protein n=1 Tax=Polaromonas glacialis TaxID=866564 RepID=UPI000497D37C|nr:hypothetical protein [Polaromonas glacialis]
MRYSHARFELVRSLDAVRHRVASSLRIATRPKAACRPIVKAMKISWRALAYPWAQRRMLVDFLAQPSQNANARTAKQQ